MATGNRPAIRADLGRWRRLGELLEQRRADLGYGGRQRARFAREHSVSVRRVTDIETAGRKKPGSWTIGTLKELAGLYRVSYESMGAVLRGEADELAAAQPAVPAAAPPGTGLPMSAEARAAAAPYADRIWERLVELAAAGVTGPSGAQVFPGSPADARAWDVFAERRWPVPPRVWMVADLQAGDAPPPGREQDAAG